MGIPSALSKRAQGPAAVAALALLLAVLGTLQYGWLGQVREAERERLRATAARRGEEFAADFDRQIAHAWAWLRIDSETLRARAFDRYAARIEQWRALTRPDIARDVYLIEPGKDGATPRLERFDPAAGTFVEQAWPREFEATRARAARMLETAAVAGSSWRDGANAVEEDLPALLVPIPEPRSVRREAASRDAASRDASDRRGGRSSRPAGFTLILLDPQVLEGQLLPSLVARHFGDGDSPELCVSIVSERTRRTILDTSGAAEPLPGDVSARFFALRADDAFEELARAPATIRRSGADPASDLQRPEPRASPGTSSRRRSVRRALTPQAEGVWRAAVSHRDGPIDAVVARAQERNLAVGFGILGLLGASVALLIVSAQRSRRLAQQQLAFVAGVSHELRTPVAVISTSAANLADGVVQDPEHVKRYGSVIQKEARRLGEMVAQVLEFAAPDPTRAPGQPVDLASLVHEAAAAVEAERREAGIRFDVRIDPAATGLLGDVSALRRAVVNLLSNAIKYGRAGTQVEVEVRREAGEFRLSVSDQGLGIPESERERIFEPFYRGQEAIAARVRGSGLGLSLVQRIAAAHGGKVEVQSVHGKGSRFTLRLPQAAEPGTEHEHRHQQHAPEANPSR